MSSAPNCWICLEGGGDGDDPGPVMRGCACRGDTAGFAHISCLVEYATRTSDVEHERDDSSTSDAWEKAWLVCPTCKQPHTGEVASALHEARLRQAQELPEADVRHLGALIHSGSRGDVESLRRLLEITAANPDDVGCIDLRIKGLVAMANHHSKRSEHAQSLNYLREALDLAENNTISRGYDVDEATKEHLRTSIQMEEIASAGHYGGMDYRRLVSQTLRIELQQMATHHGSHAKITFGTARNLAVAMGNEGKVAEAITFLDERLEDAKPYLGESHETTRDLLEARRRIESECTSQGVYTAKLDTSVAAVVGKTVRVLRWAKDGKKYLIRLPDAVGKFGELGERGRKAKANPSQLILPPGSPVECRGLVDAPHANGKRGTVLSHNDGDGKYLLTFDDGSTPKLRVERENVVLLFR